MKEIFSARTVEEAKGKAADIFGVPQEKITYTVLEEPKRGFLGLSVKGEAKVEAYYEPSKEEVAVHYLTGVLQAMGIPAQINGSKTEGGIFLEITGDETGTVIGRRGETLDALQYLTSMVANKSDKEYFRICVDSCGYREKRKKTLEELAAKIARTVLKTGRPTTLEPMNPYERRIIHSAVAAIDGVSSKSTGEDPNRWVVISADNPRPFRPAGTGRSSRGGRSGSNNGHPNRNKNAGRPNRGEGGREQKGPHRVTPPRSLDLSTSFEKEYKKPRPKLEDELNLGDDLLLFGKADVENPLSKEESKE